MHLRRNQSYLHLFISQRSVPLWLHSRDCNRTETRLFCILGATSHHSPQVALHARHHERCFAPMKRGVIHVRIFSARQNLLPKRIPVPAKSRCSPRNTKRRKFRLGDTRERTHPALTQCCSWHCVSMEKSIYFVASELLLSMHDLGSREEKKKKGENPFPFMSLSHFHPWREKLTTIVRSLAFSPLADRVGQVD